MSEGARSSLRLIEERARARARLAALWMAWLWASGQSSADQGVTITAGEVERLLLDPADTDELYRRWLQGDSHAAALATVASGADEALSADAGWAGLVSAFALSGAEADLLCLLLALESDPRLRRVIAYLQDDARATAPTAMLALSLFRNGATLPIPLDGLLRWRLAHPIDGAGPWYGSTAWQVDSALLLSVAEGRWRDPLLEGAVKLITPESLSGLPCLYPRELAQLKVVSERAEVALVGVEGAGRETLAAQCATGRGRGLLVIDAEALIARSGSSREALVAALRMARATNALPYWRNAESISTTDWASLRDLAPLQLRGERRAPAGATLVIELPKLSTAQRLEAWAHYRVAPPPAVLAAHQLTPGEIARVAQATPDGYAAIRAALRSAAPVQSELLHLLECPYTWDDMVLPPDLLAQLREFEMQVRFRWEVYENWGFARLTHLGNGIAALFGGPSGTGKTMAAQVLARSLGLDLYRVDLAGVVNKYIGETEKRLRDVFDACERAGALLFFDEADALFGSRMQVKDSHDRFANIEIDYLLQRIERFNGVAILATNRKNDLDAAFLRRLRFVVDFLMPAPAERRALWERALLPAAPSGASILEEIDFAFLASRLEVSGAQIKATALGAAFLAKAEGTRIGMRHVTAAAQRELAKHGATLRTPLRQVAG